MLLAHRIALAPNNKQAAYFARASGVARFAYNWALAEWRCQYKAGGKPSEMMLRKRLNALKREQFPWMLEVSKCAAQEAIINLGVSFSNFFRDCKKPKAQRRFHYPKPKKKGVHDSMIAFARRTKSAASAVTASASNCLSSAGFGCARLYGSRALPNM